MNITYKNTGRKLLGSLLIAGGIGSGALCTSCSDFLEVEPQNVVTIDQFWNEENDVEQVILGCYAAMSENDYLSRLLVWGEFRSENIVSYSSTIEKDKNLEKILNENLTADNGYTVWTSFYNIINRCNTIIDHAPDVAENDPSYTESEMKAHIAEAVALRSLSYFYLIRTFRDVPYNESTYYDDGQQLAIPATSFEDVLDKLINSLEEVKDDAIETYPKVTSLARYYNTGRITKWAIYAMLCDMYLWKEDYDNCIKYANLVIERKAQEARDDDETTDYSDFYGYPLIASLYRGYSNYYGQAFNEIFVDGNSQESIFELNFVKNSDRGYLSNTPVGFWYGMSGFVPYCNASEYVLADMSATTPSVFSNKYDGRGYECLRYNTSGDPEQINKFTCETAIDMTSTASLPVSFTSSYWGTRYSFYSESGSDYSLNRSNWIIYRLTDIMLLKAEAYAQKMSDDVSELTVQDSAYLDSAFKLVDAVNRRALYVPDLDDAKYSSYLLNKSDYGTKLSLTNLVYAERERELIFEGKRWFDLVRRSRRDGNTSYMREMVKQKSASNSTIIESLLQKMDRIYWPYNLDELKVNEYLTQNPAFGSGENSSYEATANN